MKYRNSDEEQRRKDEKIDVADKCRSCNSKIKWHGLDANLCVSCGWVRTLWGEKYYKWLEEQDAEKKALRSKAQKELKIMKEKEVWDKSNGMSQLDLFEYNID
jgi:hypothetical protein